MGVFSGIPKRRSDTELMERNHRKMMHGFLTGGVFCLLGFAVYLIVKKKYLAGKQLPDYISPYVFPVLIVLFSFLTGYYVSQTAVHYLALGMILFCFSVLEWAGLVDAYTMKIPNLCSLVLLGGRILFMIPELLYFQGDLPMLLLNSFVPGIIALLLLCLLYRISRSGLGMGDIKIFTALAFFTGMYGFCVTLLFSFLLCALCSLPVLLLKKKKLKDALPLGPFIYLGFGLAAILSLI